CSLSHQYLHSFPTRRSSDLFSCFSLEYSILRKQPYHHLTLHAALKTYSKSDKYWLQHRTRLQLYSLHYKSPQLHHSLLLTLNYLDRKSTRLNSSHVSISYAV